MPTAKKRPLPVDGSFIDPSHIINSKRRAVPAVNYKDTTTNRPTPKAPSSSSFSATKKAVVVEKSRLIRVVEKKRPEGETSTKKTTAAPAPAKKSTAKVQVESKHTTKQPVTIKTLTRKGKAVVVESESEDEEEEGSDSYSESSPEEEEEEEEEEPIKVTKKRPAVKRKTPSSISTSAKNKPITSVNRTIHR